MTRYEDINRELFDEDGVINIHIAEKIFKNKDIIIRILKNLDDKSFENARSAIDEVTTYKKTLS